MYFLSNVISPKLIILLYFQKNAVLLCEKLALS